MITITLAGPPRGKGRPRFVRATGRTYTDAKTESYEAALRLAAQHVMAGKVPLDGPLYVDVDAWFPIPSGWPKKKREAAARGEIKPTVKPDLDNLIKCLDAFNGIVWQDDKQIVCIQVAKLYAEAPRLEVFVGTAGEAA